jgi:predicted metalloenzyme YecM
MRKSCASLRTGVKTYKPLLLRQLHKLELPFAAEMPYSSEQWDFSLIEKNDLSESTDLIMSCMKKEDMTFGIDWFSHQNIKLGMRSRGSERLTRPSLSLSNDSILIAATVRDTSRIVGMVELTLAQVKVIIKYTYSLNSTCYH